LLNVENIPGQNGIYAAVCLTIAAPSLPPPTAASSSSPWDRLPAGSALDQAFAHAELGVREKLPNALLRYRIGELLEALAWSGFVPRRDDGQAITDRVRMLLAAAPGDDWRAEDVAARLAMSPATLRRKLAAEGSGFRHVLEEVRLGHALALVQGSRQPLKWVALDCGYQSASRFAERFRERFGCLPSELRGTDAGDPPSAEATAS
jgi:AraC-like DNA-binding protein